MVDGRLGVVLVNDRGAVLVGRVGKWGHLGIGNEAAMETVVGYCWLVMQLLVM